MTPQEQELLSSLTQKINQTQLQEKDPEAEEFLRRELGSNPDAVYILAQTVLVQNIALEQAKAQVGQLQGQLQQAQQSRPQPAHSTSFLGRLLGERDEPQPPSPGQGAYAVGQPPQGQGSWGGQQPPPYQPVPNYSQPQYSSAPQYAPAPSGQPSFLRGAMQTAAGVAAGALAFEGIESILHGFGHGGGYGVGGFGMGPGVGMGGGFGRPIEETVINNYYDEPGTRGFDNDRSEGEHHGEGSRFIDAGFDRSGSDSDTGDDGGSLDTSNFESGSDDMSGFDDGGDDGGSGLDDGGGFDDGGGGDLS